MLTATTGTFLGYNNMYIACKGVVYSRYLSDDPVNLPSGLRGGTVQRDFRDKISYPVEHLFDFLLVIKGGPCSKKRLSKEARDTIQIGLHVSEMELRGFAQYSITPC